MFPRSVTINFDKTGASSFWLPRTDQDFLNVENGLANRPLSAMGFALQISMGGPKYRWKHRRFIDRAFNTDENPFVPIYHPHLEAVIQMAYNTYVVVSQHNPASFNFTMLPDPNGRDTERHRRAWARIVDGRRNSIPSETPQIKSIMKFLLNSINNAALVQDPAADDAAEAHV
eukprot:UC4_evm1s1465